MSRLRRLDDRAISWLRALRERLFPEPVEEDDHGEGERPGSWPLTVPEQDITDCARCGARGTLTWAAMGGIDVWDGYACTVCPHRWAVRANV